MQRALPGLADLARDRRTEFLFRHMQLLRTLRLAAGAAEFLRECAERDVRLGIVSNAQAYTLRELEVALQSAGLTGRMFQADLSFWSFQNGFSKPDPHVFRMLAARLGHRGIRPAETLMIGDRLDNDIDPARAQGFQTWLLTESVPEGSREGTWQSLRRTVFPGRPGP